MNKPITFLLRQIPENIHRLLKVEAAKSGVSMSSYIVDIFKTHLAKLGHKKID